MIHNLLQLADSLSIFNRPVVILDLETTGGDFYKDRITEIAFLHIQQGKITPISQLINPQQNISPFIENLTGISNNMVANAPLFSAFLPKILPFLQGSLLIAHNSRFDYTFLRHESQRAGISFAMHSLCSVQLSRRLYPEFHKHSLDAIIERHGLHTDSRHRAMSDVLNLAHYLQTALLEKNSWQQHAQALIQPAMLPEPLSTRLQNQLDAIPDRHGVCVWYNERQQIIALHTHEMAFRETVVLLNKQPEIAKYVAHIEFHPAVGHLHCHSIRAQIMHQHRLLPNEAVIRHGIHFETDAYDGCLKAYVRPIKSGFHTTPPHGLFMHPKAAKRELNIWSKQHGICPTQLGILPTTPPKDSPCPVTFITNCVPACLHHDADAHNQHVQAALTALPICDWGKHARVSICETDVISGQTQTFICDNGALQLDEQLWFMDKALLDTLKLKFKKHQEEIQTE